MVAVTGTVQKQAWVDGVMPPVEKVRPGLWSIPVPIPNNPLRYVLVYALELTSGVAIIDAGWDTEEAWQALTDGLVTAGGSVDDVRAVLVTHIHPDHYGLAGKVRERSGAVVGLHPADAALLQARYDGVEPLLASMRELMLRSGVPTEELEPLGQASMGIRPLVNQAMPDLLFEDGQHLDLPGWDLRTVWTPGHSPGHVCFYAADRKLMLSGDHVLPRITPNITVHSQQRSNPLAEFLESLSAVAKYDVEEVLPAHEYRFADLGNRVDELIGHHEARLAEIAALLGQRGPQTCWQIAEGLHWSRPWADIHTWMRRAAVGETLAHLVLLESRGQADRVDGVPEHWQLTG